VLTRREKPAQEHGAACPWMASLLNLPVDLVLIRSGESEANVAADLLSRGFTRGSDALLDAGSHDSEVRLTDLGRSQARAVGRWLQDRGAASFDQLFVSPHVRALETAGEMGLPGAQWEAEHALRDREHGTQQGYGSPELKLSIEEKTRLNMSNLYWASVCGESTAQICDRIRHFLSQLSSCATGKRILIVCHLRVIQAFRIILEERVGSEACELTFKDRLPNCAAVWYSRRDPDGKIHDRMYGGKVVVVNEDGSHAKETPFSMARRLYSNEQLLELARKLPQALPSDF